MCEISVIVPVYNAEKSLETCLRSIQNQTFKNFEVIMINDGSKDKSREICIKFCEADNRFKLINQENAGPSAARNTGIDNARSKYLAFVDSDDYIENNMLEIMYSSAEESNADMTICGYYCGFVNNWSIATCHKYKPGIYKDDKCYNIAVNMIDVGTCGNIPPYSCIRLTKRDMFEVPRVRYHCDLYSSEDYLIWTQLAFRVRTLCLITDKPLYYYVRHTNSITHKYIANYWQMRKTIYSELKRTLPDTNEIQVQIDIMFIRRAFLAMSVATRTKDKKTYINDMKTILLDKELKEIVNRVPFSLAYKTLKHRYILLKFKMYPLIWIIFNKRFKKLNLK